MLQHSQTRGSRTGIAAEFAEPKDAGAEVANQPNTSSLTVSQLCCRHQDCHCVCTWRMIGYTEGLRISAKAIQPAVMVGHCIGCKPGAVWQCTPACTDHYHLLGTHARLLCQLKATRWFTAALQVLNCTCELEHGVLLMSCGTACSPHCACLLYLHGCRMFAVY